MKINKVQIRNLQIEDYDQLAQSFTRVYSDEGCVLDTQTNRKADTHLPRGADCDGGRRENRGMCSFHYSELR